MATEANIDLNKIKGSGKHGVVLKEDIMSLMGSKPPPSEPVPRGIIPEDKAAEVPPDDPPGEYLRFHGFLVAPKGTLSVLPL